MLRRLIVLLLLVSLVGYFVAHHHPTKANPAPCSNGSAPCIAILDEANNLVAKVNDFRFGSQGCIWYRKDTTDQWKQHCGGYHMNWIGPGNAPGVEGKI